MLLTRRAVLDSLKVLETEAEVAAMVVSTLLPGYYRATLIDGRTIDFGAMTPGPLDWFVTLASHHNPVSDSQYQAFTAPAAAPIYHTDMYDPGVGNVIMMPAEHIESVETGIPL